LTDDTARPLSGITVNFTVGSQSCSATTNVTGVASCTIAKLTQKPGNHALTASFAGTADYLVSSTNVTFTTYEETISPR
jgi:hypothetical protein